MLVNERNKQTKPNNEMSRLSNIDSEYSRGSFTHLRNGIIQNGWQPNSQNRIAITSQVQPCFACGCTCQSRRPY